MRNFFMRLNPFRFRKPGSIITATAHVRESGGRACVKISGDWLTTENRTGINRVLRDIRPGLREVSFDCSALGKFDSALVCLILRIYDACADTGAKFDMDSLPRGPRSLLELAVAVPEKKDARKAVSSRNIFYHMGRHAMSTIEKFEEQMRFFGELVMASGNFLAGRARFRVSDLMLAVQRAGPEALPIVGLISFLVGLILAFVGAIQLAKYGSEIFVADLVGLAMVREMGAMMVAIVMAGRTGAAYSAELGSMNVNEEIAAFRTFGISPLEFLVVPRILALIMMFPLLTVFADFIGMLGGFAIGWGMFDINYDAYMGRTMASLDLVQCATGVGKSLLFGVIVAVVGCMKGMTCGSSSSAVGLAATSSVVTSITLIIVADAIFAVLFNIFGI